MNVLLGLYLEGGTRREMDAFGWALLRGIATHRGIEWLDGKKPNSMTFSRRKIRQSDLPKTKRRKAAFETLPFPFTFINA